MNGNYYKKEIERIIKKARTMCPEVTDDTLDTDGAIHYMNGNDSTPFDWNCNGRLCEFMVFHKNEMGFVKVFVNRDHTVDIYIYADGGMKPTYTLREQLELDSGEFANLMNHIADNKLLWDKPIDELDWDVDTTDCYSVDVSDDDY